VTIEPVEIERSLTAAEVATAAGGGVAGTGFWKAVAALKRRPDLVERHADRVAEIDRSAFENWAFYTMPVIPGTVLMIVATLAGAAAVGMAYFIDGEVVATLVFYAGVGVLLVSTHGLAHLLVGRAAGMEFTHWFIGTVGRPQPGVKVDYATYLRSPAASRAWMHASGAIVTKLVPFALTGAAVAAELPAWAVWGLVAIGVVSVVADVLWSTKASDWKKYAREMRFAQEPPSGSGIDPSV
jgi:hypothetical protein